MPRLFGKLATLATAVEAARRYAKSNPDKAGRYLDQAASFVDKQTKGRYKGQIDGVARKAKGLAGIPAGPGTADPAGNGTAPTQGFQHNAGYGAPGYTAPADAPTPPQPQPAPRPAPRPEH